ncbi:indolethylamine N-methyltransferase-like [Ascaphus truei]|uniref:indolethylamine N-methyltransferase-like n=1 Tax=Ascaphus truei TaxID=8439 RepID=UPI003F5991F7
MLSPKSRGGLGVPDVVRYYLAAQLKQAVVWNCDPASARWLEIESHYAAPSTLQVLMWCQGGKEGGQRRFELGAMRCTWDTWTKSKGKYGLLNTPSQITPIFGNPNFPPGCSKQQFDQFQSLRIRLVADLLKNGEILTFKEVQDNYRTDFLAHNRAEVQKWLKKDPDAFDWSPVTKFVCELEGDSDVENWKEKEGTLCRTVKQVLKCDVLKRNPFEPEVLPPADPILSCLCLEVACKDIQSLCNTLKHFHDLIKPGGHLIVLSSLNCSFYFVGQKCFNCMAITKEGLELAFKGAGYEIEKLEVLPREDRSALNISDSDSYYFVHDRKPHNL